MSNYDPYASTSIKKTDTDATKLNREQISDLMGWCDWQDESLWDGMTLQEILNIWHLSIDYDNFEAMAEHEGDKARAAWNAVTQPDNHLRLIDQ